MVNKIVKTIGFLVSQATKVIAGMVQHAEVLPLPYSTAANLPGKMTALNTSNNAHKQALLVMKEKQVTLKSAVRTARRFMMVVRENLKPILGTRYNEQWSAAGFAGGLAVPSSGDKLLNALQVMKGYLTAHPIPDGGPTLAAARAGQLYDDLSAAIIAVTQQKQAVKQALKERDEKADALEKGLRTVLSELHQVITPVDAKWLSFGFKMPGIK
ncbi:MAG: hypothetical protein ACK4UN_15660, partial [Limisphaerales bacterium]